MSDAVALLDQQLRSLNRSLLTNGGQIKMADAKARAEREYEQFSARRKAARKLEADRFISELKAIDREIPSAKRRGKS